MDEDGGKTKPSGGKNRTGSPRVLLCIPPLNEDMYTPMFGGLLRIATSLIPQGICHLGSISRQAGYETSILDCQGLQLSMQEAVNEVLEKRPDYLGLSTTTLSIDAASQLARAVKELLPDVTTIVGGYHVSALPVETMQQYPYFDFGVVGEGEVTFSELLNTLSGSGDPSTVEGIVYLKGDRIVQTERRKLISNLDELPMPAWEMLPKISKYYGSSSQRYRVFPVASVITSRGCPHVCTFCDRSVFGNRFRGHSAEYVMEMIRRLMRDFAIKSIVFNDDLFIANKRRLTEICESIISENLNLSWSCDGRVDRLDDEMLKLMKRAGCWQLAVGVESGEPEILKRLGKGTDLNLIRAATQKIKKFGMSIKGFFVMGTPYETPGTIDKTIKFAKSLPLDEIQITVFTPFPGTDLFEYVVQEEGFHPVWSEMNTAAPCYVPLGMTKQQLIDAQKRGYKEFYLRPRQIGYQLSKLKSPRFALRMFQEAFYFGMYLFRRG